MKISKIAFYKYSPAFCANHVAAADDFSLKTGGNLPFVGTVAALPEVFNIKTRAFEKCLLLYLNDDKNGCFRLVKNDPQKLRKISDFYKNHPEIADAVRNASFSLSDEIKNQISRINPQAREAIEDVNIAEIVYTTLNHPAELQKLQELGYKKINPDGDVVCIQNFIVNKKNYKDAYKIVAIPLLKGLQKNGDKNIVQKAIAFGTDSYSPVNLYLYWGFKPLSADLEQIEKSRVKTAKGMRIDPKMPVVMYLPEDALLYKYINRLKDDDSTVFYRKNA